MKSKNEPSRRATSERAKILGLLAKRKIQNHLDYHGIAQLLERFLGVASERSACGKESEAVSIETALRSAVTQLEKGASLAEVKAELATNPTAGDPSMEAWLGDGN